MGPEADARLRSEVENGATLIDPLTELLTEIRSLLDAPAGTEPPRRAVVENMLTTGYAHALVLEGNRLRVEQRLKESIRAGAAGGTVWADELGELTRQLDQADRELAHLRAMLATLRAQVLNISEY